MDRGDGYLPSAYATWIIRSMIRVESLLVTAYQRSEEARRRKEHKDQWCAAYVYLDPPTDDARRYLDSRDLTEFELAVAQAVQAYLENGTAYGTDLRILDYIRWLEKIEKLKKDEAQRLLATDAADKYNDRLNREIAAFASQLDHERTDLAGYFRAGIKDRRYTDRGFEYVLSQDDAANLDGILISVANRKLGQLCSHDLRPFIGLPSQYYRLYFPLPKASYSFRKLPCIDISFDILAAAYAGVWLRSRKKSFSKYEFSLPWMAEEKGFKKLEQRKFLGYHYLILRPGDLGEHVFWKSIPLVLLNQLLNGEERLEGCSILEASEGFTTYQVLGFEERVEMPDEFAEYLKSIGSIDELVSTGVMIEKVSNIVRDALGNLEKGHNVQSTRDRPPKRGSLKEESFRSFDEGKRPSDPDVKALGGKPNTFYRYYQEWKKAQTGT